MSPLTRRGRDLGYRLWKLTRHDIGRKLTALVMAVALWSTLQNLVIGRQPLELAVHSVPTQAAADQERRNTPGVYLVVPDELIVIAVSEPSVRLTVTGLRDEVLGLNMSAILPFFLTDLGGSDEITLERPLEKDAFSVPRGQDNPRLTSFRVRPDVLEVTLARRETAEISLTADNVVTAGPPKEGYLFRSSRISLSPSVVGITGPQKVIKPLVEDSSLVKLEPIDINGKSVTVSQRVGLAQELLDKGVTLQAGGSGQVLVIVPIEAEDTVVELVAVPIEYRNEDALILRHQKVTSATKTLDIRVVGPPVELNGRSNEDLLANILLVWDWKKAPPNFDGQATGKVTVYKSQLPESVSVTDLKGNERLQIEYTLESTNTPGAADGK